MKQTTNPLLQSVAAIGFLIFITAPMTHSATIANWKVLAGTAVGSNLSTDSPTIGNGTLNNADASNSAGRFGTVATPESVTLAVGQTLTVSTTVVLTGGNASQDFRFGVFNAATEFASGTTTFASGGILLQPANGIATPGRFYQARTDGNFGSTLGNAVLLGGTVTSTGTLDVDSIAPLTWTLSITRDSATTVDLFGSIIGGDGNYNFSITANDVANLPVTYNVFGINFAGSSDLEQAVFSGAQYSVIPEPSSAVLSALFVMGGCCGAGVELRHRSVMTG